MNDIDRMRPRSTQDANGAVPLNSALVWKVWLRIDDCTDEINQPFTLPFNEIDNFDDLKTRLFEKLNNSRWAALNDNASIAIGFRAAKDDNENERDELPPLVKPSPSPVFGSGNCLGRNNKPLIPAPLAVDTSRSVLPHRSCSSVTTSPQRSASNSPRLQQGPKMTSIRHGSASPYGNLNAGSRKYSPVPLVSAAAPEAEKSHLPGTLNKGYQFPSEESLDHPERPRVLFEPDELVINIYRKLFGHMGSQRASSSLLIICNEEERILEPLSPPPPPIALDTLTATTYIPTNEEIAQQLLESQNFEPKDSDDFHLTTPPATDLGLGLDGEEGTVLLQHRISSEAEGEEEKEREFKLITNEEQLRKESQSLQDAEHSVDSPKPAILLLPKNYTGDVDFNEDNDLKPPSEPASPGTITYNDPFKDAYQSELPIPASSYAPLDEKEVGLIHPMLESERRKNTGSCPASPDLPNRPETVVPTLPSRLPSTTSLQKGQLPWGLITANHEIFPKITVLIVEDNVINQAILRSFLKKHKISYKVAKNGQEAVDRWKEGGIDLIFMDLQLPVFSGMDAAKKIRDLEKLNASSETLPDSKEGDKKRSKAPVIIVAFTASNTRADKREALLSGCNDYLTKPVNLHWLSKKINEWGCMQALIDFDSWKQGQSRMTDSVLMKASPKLLPKASESSILSNSSRVDNRSNSSVSQVKMADSKTVSKNHSRHSTERDRSSPGNLSKRNLSDAK